MVIECLSQCNQWLTFKFTPFTPNHSSKWRQLDWEGKVKIETYVTYCIFTILTSTILILILSYNWFYNDFPCFKCQSVTIPATETNGSKNKLNILIVCEDKVIKLNADGIFAQVDRLLKQKTSRHPHKEHFGSRFKQGQRIHKKF